MRKNLRSRLIPAALAGVLLLVTACGDDSGPTDPGNPDPDPPPAPVPARVEIHPGAALVPGVGASMALRAVVYDAAGAEIDTTVVWQSRTPGVAAVSAGGLLTGSTIGSTQITAAVGTVVSPPVLALVAEPAPGVVLIPDSLIVSDPEPVDPAAEVEAGWEYRIRILGGAPAVGTRVLGTGARPLAGEVTAVSPQGAETELTVAFVPLNQLFDNLVIDEVIPLVEMPEAQGAPPLLRAPEPTAAPARAEGSTEFAMGPFQCKATGTVPNLDLPEPKLEITSQLALLLGYDNALTSLVVEGSVNADFEYKPVFKAVFTGKVSCEAMLRTFTVPLNGFLSYFVGIQVPVGIGMELNGKLDLAEVGFEVTSTAGASATLGLLCPNGDGLCTALTDFETSNDFSFKPVIPDLEDQFKLELGGYGFVFAKPAIGSAFSSAIQWEFLAASAGLEQTFDVATAKRQAQDTAYASGFRLIGKVDVGPGADLTKAMDKLKDWLGQELTPDLTLVERRDTLARSPGGAFTITPARVAPGDTAAQGDLAKFRVELDPVTYLGLESVDKVEFRWRKETEGSTDFTLENARPACQEVPGGGGKTVFECETDFLEEHTGRQDFHAFVHARMFGFPLPIPLEVAKDGKAQVEVGDQIQGLGFWIPLDVSYDGDAVLGIIVGSGDGYFLWKEDSDLLEVVTSDQSGDADAGAMSGDGQVVVGSYAVQEWDNQGFVWRAGGLTVLPMMDDANAVSGDGSLVVGNVRRDEEVGNGHDFWVVTDTRQELGRGLAIAADSTGSVIVGYGRDARVDPVRVAIWRNGARTLLGEGQARDVSPDGVWVVGQQNGMAFRNGPGGTQGLWSGAALSVNRDGTIIVGTDDSLFIGTPLIWTEWGGVRPLISALEDECGYNLSGWELTRVRHVSADGSVIIGDGISPAGVREAWRVPLCSRVGTPPSEP